MTGYDFPAHINRKVDQATDDIKDLTARVTVLEKDGAVTEVRMTTIQKSLSTIESTTGWLLKTVIGGFVVAVIAFIVKGGLSG